MTLQNWNLKCTPCGLVGRKDIVGRESGGGESGKDPGHPFGYCSELQQGEADILSLVSLRTWDLKRSAVVINETELPTCLGVSSSGTTSKPNPQHRPLLFVPSGTE